MKKKLLAMLLAAAMVLSLAACSSSSTEDTSTDASADTTEETETADASDTETASSDDDFVINDTTFTWNGQMEVWSILPTTQAEGLVAINDCMGEIMEAAGFTYVKKDSEGTPGNQVTFVEDAIAAGNVGALMIAAMDVELLEDVVLEALDAGIAVVYLGAQPTGYEICGVVYTAYELTGMWAVEAAEDWVENRVAEGGDVPTNADGQYEVAADIYTSIVDGVYRSNAVVGTIAASDTLVQVSETTSYADGYETAYSNTQGILEANPDCHIYIAYEPEPARGIADAIADYCDTNGLDLADYCVISCYGEEDAFAEYYAEALADASSNAIKGYSTYGDTERNGEEVSGLYATGAHLADALLYACSIDENDSISTWTTLSSGGGSLGETYYDTITVTNIYGFSNTWVNGDENPASEYKTATFTGMAG